MTLSQRDIQHVFERLRSGVVPERGLEAFAVGIDAPRGEIHRQFQLLNSGEGGFKFLRGGYGCGKTFMSRLAVQDAHAQGFATSFVVVSDNDLKFYKFDELYRKIVAGLSTSTCPRGALPHLIDRWVAKVEDMLIEGGADEDAADFDAQVQARLKEELTSSTQGKAPVDMNRVLSAIFDLKQQGKLAEAGALLSWLGGSPNVAAKAKAAAGIRGEVGSAEAMAYLRGILEIVKAAGYKGLVVILDEVETVLRMRRDVRGKCLNGLRQICDDAGKYPGMLWMFTGTPDFFDTQKGVKGLEPLYERIKFTTMGGFSNPRQPQLELRPFDRKRLNEVALKLREIYPTTTRTRLNRQITQDFISQLVDDRTAAFGGKVDITPRAFLREFVNVLDTADANEAFDPRTIFQKQPDMSAGEQRLSQGKAQFEAEDDGDDDAGQYDPIEF